MSLNSILIQWHWAVKRCIATGQFRRKETFAAPALVLFD